MISEYKTVKKELDELDDVYCNICGKSCKKEMNFEYAYIIADWGYDSQKDLEVHEAHICEECYDEKILPLFKINPKIPDGKKEVLS